ncbi:unnamed protein product [Pedinophyceae sp. YPF-701]|nr:unnamed protein product [Pedinophyceae sp. YPF-701]
MFMDGAQADLLQRMERTLQEAIGGHARVQARAKWLTGKPEGRAKEHIFWNDNTGAWQDTDPGSAPCLGDHGETWWEIALDKHGTIRQNVDSLGQRYAWVEVWDDRRHRPFYQHRRMHYSSIDRPVDLAWRRVNMEDVSNVEDADMPYSPFGISM